MSTFRPCIIAAVVLPFVLGCASEPEPTLSEFASRFDPVPAKLQGVWAPFGKCNSAKDRVTIAARTLRWGGDKPEVIGYGSEDGFMGFEGGIHFVEEEGVVSTFAHRRETPDELTYLAEGFDGPAERWERCR